MPTIQIERPEGGVDQLEFPDETPQSVIDSVVQNHVKRFQRAASTQAFREAASEIPKELQRFGVTAAPTEVLSEPGFGKQAVSVGKTAMRVGPPIAAGFLSGGASLPVQAALGALAAAGGEAGAQAVEVGTGERPGMRPGAIVGAGVSGAIPGLPGGGFGGVVKNMAAQGAGAAAGGIAENVVEGEAPSLAGASGRAAMAAGFTGALRTPAELLKAALGSIEAGIKRASTVQKATGVEATIEQAFPSMAPSVRRIVERGVGDAAEKINAQQALQQASIFNNLYKLSGGLDPEAAVDVGKRVLKALDPESATQFARDNEMLNGLNEALGKAQDQVQKARIQTSIDSMEGKLRATAERALGMPTGTYGTVVAGQKAASNINQALGGFRETARKLYEPSSEVADQNLFDADIPVNGGPSLVEQAKELLGKLPSIGGLGDFRKLISRAEQAAENAPEASILADRFGRPISDIGQPEPSFKVSLNTLRGIRSELEDYAATPNQAIGTNQKRLLKDFADKIRTAIDEQADAALGPDVGESLRKANKFYSDFKPRFDDLGIRDPFVSGGERAEGMVDQIANEIASKGIDTQRYKNIVKLFEDLRADPNGVPGVPDAKSLNESIRQALIGNAITDKVSGKVDFEKLAQTLSQAESQQSGTIARLGFGSIRELKEYAQKMPQYLGAASKQDVSTLEKLIKSDNTFAINQAKYLLQNLSDAPSISGMMETLIDRATSGNKAAADAVRSIRSKYLQEMFAVPSIDPKAPDIVRWDEAIKNFKDSLANTTKVGARQILGPDIIKTIQTEYLPALEIMAKAQREVRNVGMVGRGQSLTTAAQATGQAVSQTAAGNIGTALGYLGGKLSAEVMYPLVSKILTRNAGISGMRSQAARMRVFEKLLKMPRPAALVAAYKYADTGEEP